MLSRLSTLTLDYPIPYPDLSGSDKLLIPICKGI